MTQPPRKRSRIEAASTGRYHAGRFWPRMAEGMFPCLESLAAVWYETGLAMKKCADQVHGLRGSARRPLLQAEARFRAARRHLEEFPWTMPEFDGPVWDLHWDPLTQPAPHIELHLRWTLGCTQGVTAGYTRSDSHHPHRPVEPARLIQVSFAPG